MECHREEHLFLPHPPEPCDHIGNDIRPAMADVHGAARVRERNGNIKFFEIRRVGLKRVEPPFVRFFFKFAQIKFGQNPFTFSTYYVKVIS
jgi:hypothetical protein